MTSVRLPLAVLVAFVAAYVWAAHACAEGFLLGHLQDDGVYALAARALAHGQGYVDLALPDHAPAMRYPPGFPAILALAIAGATDAAAEVARIRWVAPVAAGCWILACCGYFRRRAGLPACLAAALAVLAAVQPSAFGLASQAMAELPFALACLGAVWAAEALLARGASQLTPWAGVGAAVGLACLVRSAGLELAAAVALVLLAGRARRPLAGFALGLLPLLGGWLLYQHGVQSGDYVSTYLTRLPTSPGLAGVVAGTVLVAAFGNVLPSAVFGWPFLPNAPAAWWSATLGLVASAWLLWGLAARLRRPFDPARAIGPAFAIACLAGACAYALAFSYYAEAFMQRAMIPALPFVVLAAWEASHRVPRRVATAGLAAAIAAGAWGSAQLYRPSASLASLNAEGVATFAYVDRSLPAGAVCMAPYAYQLAVHTGRYAVDLPLDAGGSHFVPTVAPARAVIARMAQAHVGYLVAMPRSSDGEHDDCALVVEALERQVPGLVRRLYASPGGNYAIFAVDRARLASQRPGGAW